MLRINKYREPQHTAKILINYLKVYMINPEETEYY
jgi:hypothetical protein